MCLHSSRLQLFRALQDEFSKAYPFLRIEFAHPPDKGWIRTSTEDEDQRCQAADILKESIGLADGLTVAELEHEVKAWFGMPVQLLRKSGKVWMDTSHTSDWSLKKQNDAGRAIATGFQ